MAEAVRVKGSLENTADAVLILMVAFGVILAIIGMGPAAAFTAYVGGFQWLTGRPGLKNLEKIYGVDTEKIRKYILNLWILALISMILIIISFNLADPNDSSDHVFRNTLIVVFIINTAIAIHFYTKEKKQIEFIRKIYNYIENKSEFIREAKNIMEQVAVQYDKGSSEYLKKLDLELEAIQRKLEQTFGFPQHVLIAIKKELGKSLYDQYTPEVY